MDICTTASVFEKENSLKFELLFGIYAKKQAAENMDKSLINACDYLIEPNQIMGYAYESTGKDYQKMHHAFILRTCAPGERGHSVLGITPGAEILISAFNNAAVLRLKMALKQLEKNKLKLADIRISDYQRLKRLLETKLSLKFFIGELLANNPLY